MQLTIYAKVTAPVKALERMAERMHLRVKLRKLATAGAETVRRKNEQKKGELRLDAGFAKFDRSAFDLFEPFTDAQREMLVRNLITAPVEEGGAGIVLQNDIDKGLILQAFAGTKIFGFLCYHDYYYYYCNDYYHYFYP